MDLTRLHRQRDRRTDRQAERVIPIYAQTLFAGGIISVLKADHIGSYLFRTLSIRLLSFSQHSVTEVIFCSTFLVLCRFFNNNLKKK